MSKKSKDLVSNRKAFHDYEILDTFEAGIVLKGTEIKSLRNHDASLQEAFVKILNNEVWLINSYIAPYKFGNIYNHDERRERKLLMHKREIGKLKSDTQEKGIALVPIALYLSKGRVKVKIATAKGKKKADKRQAIKEREDKRNIDRMMKNAQD